MIALRLAIQVTVQECVALVAKKKAANPCRGFGERVSEIVRGESVEDHAQGVSLVAQCCGAGSEDTLAGGAAPELDDFQFFSARASAREHVAAAMRTA